MIQSFLLLVNFRRTQRSRFSMVSNCRSPPSWEYIDIGTRWLFQWLLASFNFLSTLANRPSRK